MCQIFNTNYESKFCKHFRNSITNSKAITLIINCQLNASCTSTDINSRRFNKQTAYIFSLYYKYCVTHNSFSEIPKSLIKNAITEDIHWHIVEVYNSSKKVYNNTNWAVSLRWQCRERHRHNTLKTRQTVRTSF